MNPSPVLRPAQDRHGLYTDEEKRKGGTQMGQMEQMDDFGSLHGAA
jgi:hypothetical protein